MASSSRKAIDTFISITSALEAVAVQKLQEHNRDLNAAVNAYFNGGDENNAPTGSVASRENDFMATDDLIDFGSPVPPRSFLSAAQYFNPFSILTASYGQRFFDGSTTELFNFSPQLSNPREVREIPREFKDENCQHGSFGHGPTNEEVTGNVPAHGPEVRGNVIIYNKNEDFPRAPADHGANESGNVSLGRNLAPNFTPVPGVSGDKIYIEEEMIQAAIKASKRDAEASVNQQFDVPNGSSGRRRDKLSPTLEDANLAHAVSLSLKTAEQENVLRELGLQVKGHSADPSGIKLKDIERVPTTGGRQGLVKFHTETSGKSILQEGNTSITEELEDVDEQALVRYHSGHLASENIESANVAHGTPSPHENDHGSRQPSRPAFQSDGWGGISSKEHDEAVMLEAAMFGGIPEGSAYNSAYPRPRVLHSDRNTDFYPWVHRPPSPSLTAQQLLLRQQENEYLDALQSDREKELKALEEAERRCSEEDVARQVKKEFERILAAKQASLPQEPSLVDENIVTLLIHMPDGSRCRRRFLKSEKLQSLFDYIDVERIVKPGTYRLVRQYPRRAFSSEESTFSLSELGLKSKQEALFLELI